MDSGERQIIFCDLLRYYRHGHYSDFKNIMKILYGETIEKDRYLCHNQFLAARIAGLIEVTHQKDTLEWAVAFADELEIRSIKPKSIGTKKIWFSEKLVCESIIVDGSKRPLIIGRTTSPPDQTPSDLIFSFSFFNFFPGFIDIESEICIEEKKSPLHATADYEMFDINSLKWKSSENINSGKYIAKVKVSPYKYTYYLIDNQINLFFRVIHAEWVFIAARHVLNFPIEKLFTATKTGLFLHQSLKLPTPILRFLFGASGLTTLSFGLKFQDMDEQSINKFISYLTT